MMSQNSWYPDRDEEEVGEGPHGNKPAGTKGSNPWLKDSSSRIAGQQRLPQHWAEPEAHEADATGNANQPHSYADQPLAGPWGDGSPQETLGGDYPVIANTPEQKQQREEQDAIMRRRSTTQGTGGCFGVFAVFATISASATAGVSAIVSSGLL